MKKITWLLLALLIPVFLAGAALAQEKAKPGEIQKTCFMMKGQPVNPKLFADYKGHRIYFCCSDCLDAFKKDPEKYFQAMMEAKMPMEKAPAAK